MPLFSSEINVILTRSANCTFCEISREITFAIPDTKPYVLVITLQTKDN